MGTDGFVAAVDLSSAMAEATGRRLADAGVSGEAIAADAQTDDLVAAAGDGRPFDAAHSRFGVMFFSDPPAAFTNIARCLRSGGRFAASVWKDLSANDWMAVPTITAIGPLGVEELPLPEPGAPGPFSLADPVATTELLTAAGFADVAVDPVDAPFVVGRDVRTGIVQMLRAGPLSDAYDAAAEDVRSGAVDAVEAALEPYRAGRGTASRPAAGRSPCAARSPVAPGSRRARPRPGRDREREGMAS